MATGLAKVGNPELMKLSGMSGFHGLGLQRGDYTGSRRGSMLVCGVLQSILGESTAAWGPMS